MTTNSSTPPKPEGKAKKQTTTTLSLNDFRKEVAASTPNGAPSQSRHDDFAWALDKNNDVVASKKEHETLVAEHRRNIASAAHAASSRSFAFRSDNFVPPSEAITNGPLSPPTTAPFIAFLKNLPSTNTTSEAIASHLYTKVNIKPKRTRVIVKGIAVIAFIELNSYNDLCLLLSLRTIGFGGRLVPIAVANESQRSGSDRLFEGPATGGDGGDAAERSWSELSVSTPGSSVKSASASFAAAFPPRSPATSSFGRNSISNTATPPPAPGSTTKSNAKALWRPRNGSNNGTNAISLLSREHMGNEAQQPLQPTAISNQSGNNSFGGVTNRPSQIGHEAATANVDHSIQHVDKDTSHRAYVGNLSPTVTESEITGFFVDIGVEVKNVSPLLMDKHGGSAFTFVDFGDEDQLQHILQQNGKQMLGRPMTITLPKNVSRASPPPPPPAITRHTDPSNQSCNAVLVSAPSRQLFGLDRNRFGAFTDRNNKPLCEASSFQEAPRFRAFPPSPSIGAHPITSLRRTDSCETLSSFGGTSSVSVAPTPAVTPGGGEIARNSSTAAATPPPKLILSDPAPPMCGATSTLSSPAPTELGVNHSGNNQHDTKLDSEGHGVRPCAYVGNLPTGTSEENLKKHFADALKIPIVAARVRTKGPTTFAFVDFTTETELSQAVAKNGSLFLSRPMRIVAHKEVPNGSKRGEDNKSSDASESVALAQHRAPPVHAVLPSTTHCRTYIGNLPTATTEATLKKYFAESFGISVVSARVLTKGPTTYAFVEFANKNDQIIASSKDGSLIGGRPMRIVIDGC